MSNKPNYKPQILIVKLHLELYEQDFLILNRINIYTRGIQTVRHG